MAAATSSLETEDDIFCHICEHGFVRADRLLSMIWLLRAHDRLSTADLAEHLEVSRRTVLRDVEALSAAGVPVYCERGPHGGVRLLPDYRTDVTALSSEESRALFAGVTTWGAETLGLGEALASGLRKLLAAVPETYRRESSDTSDRIVVDPQGWLPQPEQERTGETFRIVQDAVFTGRRLRMAHRHKTRSSLKEAVVDPHGLISAGSSWYLCSTQGNDEPTFTKLSRIDFAEILPDGRDQTRRIDVRAAWQAQRAKFLGGFTAVIATAWVRDTRWSDVHEWSITATEITAASAPPPGDGWMFMRLEFVDDLHAMTIMLRLGADARIEAPNSLRASFMAYLEDTLALYRESHAEQPVDQASG